MQGAIVRSHFAEMDAQSKFLFNHEKKNGQNFLIHCILSVDGSVLTDSIEIRKRAMDFFSKLYASEYREDLLMLEHFGNLSQLSAEDVADLECPLALQELQVAQMSIENGRPKSFWCDVK